MAARLPRRGMPSRRRRSPRAGVFEFLVPLLKGYATESCLDIASLGIQVHGGMGFIEETGAAQHLRDARILTIYEGTTAIQANDLVGRKTVRDGGRTARVVAARGRGHRSRRSKPRVARRHVRSLGGWGMRAALSSRWSTSCAPMRARRSQHRLRRIGSLPDAGRHAGGRLAAGAGPCWPPSTIWPRVMPTSNSCAARLRLGVLFYADHFLTRAAGLRDAVVEGAESVTALPLEAF